MNLFYFLKLEKAVSESDLLSGSPVWSTLCVTRTSWQMAGLSGSGKGVGGGAGSLGGGGGSSLTASGSKRHARSLSATPFEDTPPSPNATLATTARQQNLSLGGAELLNLLPGFYELQIMAVSLAGNSSWTPPVLFEVTTSPMGLSFSL